MFSLNLTLKKKTLYLVSGLLLMAFVVAGFILSRKGNHRISSEGTPSYYIISEEIIPSGDGAS